jgi:hypothetical protein
MRIVTLLYFTETSPVVAVARHGAGGGFVSSKELYQVMIRLFAHGNQEKEEWN